MGPELIATKTPVSPDELSGVLRTQWAKRFGAPLDLETEALLLALWDLETGTGRSMYHYNLGNIVPVGDQAWYALTDRQGNRLRFRAYNSLDHGADEFIAQLTRDTRPQWRAGLMTGDPTEFVTALKGLNGGAQYFEAPFEHYLKVFRERWSKYKAPEGGGSITHSPKEPEGLSSLESLLERLAGGLPVISDRRGSIRIKGATVYKYQRDNGLTADSIIGPKTWACILRDIVKSERE